MGRTGAPQSSPDLAQSKFELRLADDLTSRCVIHVLPKGVTDLGFTSTLPTSRRRDFAPELADADRHGVTCQTHRVYRALQIKLGTSRPR